jgi:hypothetical protein
MDKTTQAKRAKGKARVRKKRERVERMTQGCEQEI